MFAKVPLKSEISASTCPAGGDCSVNFMVSPSLKSERQTEGQPSKVNRTNPQHDDNEHWEYWEQTGRTRAECRAGLLTVT